MARKATAAPIPPIAPAAEPEESGKAGTVAVSVITLKGSPEMRDWLAAASEETNIPASTITRLGFKAWAEKTGIAPPPKK